MQSDVNNDRLRYNEPLSQHKRTQGLVIILHSDTRKFPPSADLALRCRPPATMVDDELLGVIEDDGGESDEDEALRWGGGGGAREEEVVLRMSRRSAAPQRNRPMTANFHNFILEWEALGPCKTKQTKHPSLKTKTKKHCFNVCYSIEVLASHI